MMYPKSSVSFTIKNWVLYTVQSLIDSKDSSKIIISNHPVCKLRKNLRMLKNLWISNIYEAREGRYQSNKFL